MARVPAGIKRTELQELLTIDEQIKELEARKVILRDKALRAHGDFRGTRVYGDVVLALTEANVFDAALFGERYPAEEHPTFYRLAVNTAAVPKDLKAQYGNPVPRLSVRRAA